MKTNSVAASAPRANLGEKLLGYSATAGVALLLAPAASAQTFNIVDFSFGGGSFSSTPPTVAPGVHFKVAAGSHLHVFSGMVSGFVSSSFGRVGVAADAGKVIFKPGVAGIMARLGTHDVVADPANIGNQGELASRMSNGAPNGEFVPSGGGAHKSGYMGFRTNGGDYGWLKVVVTNNAFGFPASITFATSTLQVGGQNIYGQIGSSSLTTPSSAIPEPASVATGLALFALGAVGVREHRRRKQLATA